MGLSWREALAQEGERLTDKLLAPLRCPTCHGLRDRAACPTCLGVGHDLEAHHAAVRLRDILAALGRPRRTPPIPMR